MNKRQRKKATRFELGNFDEKRFSLLGSMLGMSEKKIRKIILGARQVRKGSHE
jgi:hypothetical protein